MKIRILKRILIIPALVAILLVNISYASYRSPWVVKVEAATGNAFLDAFVTALQFVGYSVTGNAAAQSAQKDLERYLNSIIRDNKIALDMRLENNLKSKSAREQYLAYMGVDNPITYDEWYRTIYCPANNIDPDATDMTISEEIISAIQSGKLKSMYTAEQYAKANGSFKLLTMLAKDYTYDAASKVMDPNETFTTMIGTKIEYADISNTAYYKLFADNVINNMYDYYSDYYSCRGLTSACKNNFYLLTSSLMNDHRAVLANALNVCGTTYLLLFTINGSIYSDSVSASLNLVDVPEGTNSIDLYMSQSGISADYYSFCFKDENSNNLDFTSSNIGSAYANSYKENSEINFTTQKTLQYFSGHNVTLNELSAYNNNFDYWNELYMIVPVGFNSSSIPQLNYKGDIYGQAIDNLDSGEVNSVSMERTNDDLSNLVSDNVNIDEVDVKTVDEVVSDVKSIDTSTDAATDISKTLTDTITDANSKAQDRVDAEDKADDKTDTDIKDPANESDDVKKYKVKLVDIFPFCIPYDIYRFLKCLQADPVAPCFDIPIIGKNSFGLEEYTYTLDLSQFDSVAKILRTMELLAFCVGLAFVTNNLIKH